MIESMKYEQCPMSPELSELTSSIRLLTEKLDVLIVQYRDVVRWLLIVVCVIALGRSAFDLGRDVFDSTMHSTTISGSR